MKKETFGSFDAADYLETREDIAAYLVAASEEGDPQVVAAAIGDIVRARNVSKIARDTGLTREGIYKALSPEGNPSFATVWKVARALDLELGFLPKSPSKAAAAKRFARTTRASAKAGKGHSAKRRTRRSKPASQAIR
ncbi:MAG: addiction module antidote protein [Betaproteobacteria bacterium]